MRSGNARLLIVALFAFAGCGRPHPVNRPELEEPSNQPDPEPADVSPERARAEIDNQGGEIQTDGTNPDQPVVQVNLRKAKDANTALKYLRAVSNVQVLDLGYTNVSNEALRYLERVDRPASP